MATHTPAQAIQELVNHTAVLTERLVGLQQEVRKGMNMTPEWGNALTQVVGDTKRMLQAMEHLARLPAFHLDREGLNAAVAAGVQQGLSGDSGASLVTLIESNSRHLEEARAELHDAKARMDQMLEEMQGAKVMSPESRQKFFMQFAPIVGIWSVGLLLAGLMVGRGCSSEPEAPPPSEVPPAITQPQQLPQQQQSLTSPPPAATRAPVVGSEIVLSAAAPIYSSPSNNGPAAFNGPPRIRLRVEELRGDGWIRVTFATPQGRASGWMAPGTLR